VNTVLRISVPLLFALAVFGSAWYIAFRLRTTFGLQRRWLLRVLVMAAPVGWSMLMVPATKSANVVAGLSYVLGGLLFAGYLFLTLAFVVHVIERAWHIPSTVASAGRDDRVRRGPARVRREPAAQSARATRHSADQNRAPW
jgi:hypothetical protein